jgi:hypothetical protein
MNRIFVVREKPSEGYYYVYGIDGLQSAALGYADFIIYNIMILLVMPQSSSIAVNVCVIFGCIVSIQIGQSLLHLLSYLVKLESGPGIPLPVIMVSVYIFLLDIIMPNFDLCVEL